MDTMLFIAIIRLVIFITFLLLVAEGIAAIIVIRRFYSFYIRKHLELEGRVTAVERRLGVLEGQ